MRLTPKALCYLRCIDDWKAPYEVTQLLGENAPRPAILTRATLFALVDGGFAEHGKANDTFRITDAGRAALVSSKHGAPE